MKRTGLLCILVLLGAELHSQQRVDNFYSLIKSPNVKETSEYITLSRTDTCVNVDRVVKDAYMIYHKHMENFWKYAGKKIDSLNIVDYDRDTVYIIKIGNPMYHGFLNALIVTDRGMITLEDNLNKRKLYIHSGQKVIYPEFHPIVVDPIYRWDMEELSDVVYRFGSNDMYWTDGYQSAIWRIIIEDYKKIETSVLKFPTLEIFETEDGLIGPDEYYELLYGTQ